MYDKLIVAVFDGEKHAYEGVKALHELHAEGSITLYASAVIAKDAGGAVSVKQIADEGPTGTGVGLVTGTLIGVLGGPVGAAVGAGAGTFGGMLYDFAKGGVGEAFLEDVAKRIQPGNVAVVAEIQEEWDTPLDARMERVGGVVIRTKREEVLDSRIERDVAALRTEIAELKAERALARRESRAKLEAKVNATEAQLRETLDRARTAAEATAKEMEAKLGFLREQAAKAKGDAKAKLEARIASVQADYTRRNNKLQQAWQLTKDALT
jgi:uncharacterized membrane protein